MEPRLTRDPRLFVALTRPQMFGVTYSFFRDQPSSFSTRLFLLFRSPLVLLGSGLVHLAGVLACMERAAPLRPVADPHRPVPRGA